jgi:hypothetical protein
MAGELTPEIQKQLEAINEKIGGLEKQNQELAKENGELKKQMGELAASNPADAEVNKEPVVPTDAFTVNKKKYKFNTAKFTVPGIGPVTAADVLADTTKHESLGGATIKEWLVQKEAGVIAPVDEE